MTANNSQKNLTIHWKLVEFVQLTNQEIHDIFAARIEVFVVEQDCAFQDIDGRDLDAWHLLGKSPSGEIAAYARILAPNTLYAEPSLGRIITTQAFRGQNLGRELLQRSIDHCQSKFPGPIRIAAQSRLENFYAEFGFVVASKEYLEDGIKHIEMVMKP